MNQQSWIFIDEIGRQHQVGILHGPDSGHLLIHCNSNIVVIDFNVLHSKSYSIFIEEQLCNIDVEKSKNGSFSYNFVIDKEADIPINRRRNKIEKKHRFQTILTAVAFVMITIFIVVKLLQVQKQNESSVIPPHDYKTMAVINGISEFNALGETILKVENRNYHISTSLDSISIMTLQNLPLKNGDELPALISRYDQNRIELLFKEVSEKILAEYRLRTFDDIKNKYHSLENNKISCVIGRVTDLYGLPGLASLRSILLESEMSSHTHWNPEIYKIWSSHCIPK